MPDDSSGTYSKVRDDGKLVVEGIHENADGNDHENDEYVTVENTGDSALDLAGWTVSDEKDHTYSFPDGFALEPGATVTLHTGSGTDTDSALYWGSDAAIWNNDGDTIVVTGDGGETVIEASYG